MHNIPVCDIQPLCRLVVNPFLYNWRTHFLYRIFYVYIFYTDTYNSSTFMYIVQTRTIGVHCTHAYIVQMVYIVSHLTQ